MVKPTNIKVFQNQKLKFNPTFIITVRLTGKYYRLTPYCKPKQHPPLRAKDSSPQTTHNNKNQKANYLHYPPTTTPPLMDFSPPSTNSLSSSQNMYSFSQQQLFDHYSITETNLQSINTFLNSYQILKKLQTPIIDTKPYLEKPKTNHVQFISSSSHQGLTKGLTHGSSVGMLVKDSSFKEIVVKREEDEISQKARHNAESLLLSMSHNKSTSSDIETYTASSPGLRLPADNEFTALHSSIKCTNLLTRVRSMSNGDDLTQRPMFTYPEWKQVSDGIKKIFNRVLQTPMKQLNTGTLISIRPKESLSIRTDYYCFHPHQVYTTFLALDKATMNSATLGFCRLAKQFVELQFPLHNDQSELLDTINREKKEIQWEYLDLKEGDLIVVGKDVLYGSFRQFVGDICRNDSPSTKFYAEMRWVRHQSASNSSNSS